MLVAAGRIVDWPHDSPPPPVAAASPPSRGTTPEGAGGWRRDYPLPVRAGPGPELPCAQCVCVCVCARARARARVWSHLRATPVIRLSPPSSPQAEDLHSL